MADRTTFTFVRHSIAPKHPENPADDLRELSSEGRDLARTCRKKLGDPAFDLILAAPRLRHRETALLVAGADSMAPTIPLAELFTPDGPDGPMLESMFDRIGYKSLKDYFDQGTTEEVQCLRRYGLRAWSTVCEKAFERRAKDVLIVGSAIFIPATLEASLPSGQFLDWNMPDCGVARVFVEDGHVRTTGIVIA